MKISRLALVVGLLCLSSETNARTYKFDPSMVAGGNNADMTLFNEGVQLPGTYRVDVLLNGERVDFRDVVFSQEKNKQGETYLRPCLSMEDLSRYGIKVEDYPQLSAGGDCANLSAIPQAGSDFNFNNQQLLLSMPQASIRPRVTGIAPQALWDDGIPALLLNYNANTNRTEYRTGKAYNSDSDYVQLNPGANLGAWRLRNQTNWQRQGDDSGKWQTVYTYAERGLYNLKSRVTLGDRNTPDDIFDGVPFRGAMLGTDDNMLPYNQRAFAPIVRGIARTQARVEVKQNGYTIYNAVVAPGPFALSDLSTSGSSGGDLEVTVWETDGSPQVFTVAFQTPAISLREGYLQYNVMAGQYRPADSGIEKQAVSQATIMYGLPWDLTAYAGMQNAEHFQAGSLGAGLSMGDWGAVSLDGTVSHGQRRHQDTENGAAWRIRYSKDVISTNTTMTMTSYQYASSGYNTLSDVLDTWHSGDSNQWVNGSSSHRKSSSSLQLSQSLGAIGSLSLSGSRNDYWDRPGHDNTYNANYGVSLRGITLSLGLSQTKQVNQKGDQRTDRMTSLWVSMPLDRWLGGNTNATYQLLSQSHGRDSNEVGLNGRAFDQQLTWDMRQRRYAGDDSQDKDNSSLNMSWAGGYGQMGGNYNYSPHLRQMGANVSGGLLVHQHGLTVGQPLGDTTALIEAPGASGVPVGGWPGVKTDFRGYTTEANLSPYQENIVSLDPTRLPADAELPQTDTRVVPTQGAIVAAKFVTRIGARALMTLTDPKNNPVPFGAVVSLSGQGGGAGIVGEGGQTYLTGLPASGELLVKWSTATCRVNFQLPEKVEPTGVYKLKGVCH